MLSQVNHFREASSVSHKAELLAGGEGVTQNVAHHITDLRSDDDLSHSYLCCSNHEEDNAHEYCRIGMYVQVTVRNDQRAESDYLCGMIVI